MSVSHAERRARVFRPAGGSLRFDALSVQGTEADFAATLMADSPAGPSVAVVLRCEALTDLPSSIPERCKEQGFVLTLSHEQIELKYETRIGLISGLLLLEYWREQPDTDGVQLGTYLDWPDFAVRGWFMECGSGTEWMTREDWRGLIRRMSRLRLNLLGIGLYGCWCHRYDSLPECLMTPIPGEPGLTGEIMMRAANGQVLRSGPPEMYAGGFLPDLVAEAAEQGMQVMPMINLLGHNTLIPRLRPEVSARTADGRPKNYGFCTRAEATRSLVTAWLRDLTEQAFPASQRKVFCIGMDEMMELSGVDPDHLDQIVNPWCECPDCRLHSEAERLVEWIVFLTEQIVALGFGQVAIYHDECRKQNAFPQLRAALRDRQLEDRLIVIHWDYAAEPQLAAEGGESWVMPTTGLFGFVAPSVKLRNIEKSLEAAAHQGFSGVVSYTMIDDGFERAERYLSAQAWDSARFVSRDDFLSAYTEKLPDPEAARRGFRFWDGLWDSDFPSTVLEQLFFYFHGFWCWRSNYPSELQSVLSRGDGFGPAAMSATALKYVLRQAAAGVIAAETDFIRSGLLETNAGPALRFDLDRTRWILESFAPGGERDSQLVKLDHLIQRTEREKPPYLHPHYLRELFAIRQKFSEVLTSESFPKIPV